MPIRLLTANVGAHHGHTEHVEVHDAHNGGLQVQPRGAVVASPLGTVMTRRGKGASGQNKGTLAGCLT
jgi:hypothetical protein